MDLWIIIILIVIGYNLFKKKEVENTSSNKISTTKITLAKSGIGERRSSRKIVEIEKPENFDLNSEKEEVLDILEKTNQNIF